VFWRRPFPRRTPDDEEFVLHSPCPWGWFNLRLVKSCRLNQYINKWFRLQA
jgi:hypothetical protein